MVSVGTLDPRNPTSIMLLSNHFLNTKKKKKKKSTIKSENQNSLKTMDFNFFLRSCKENLVSPTHDFHSSFLHSQS